MKSDTSNIYSQYFKEIARKVLFIARILSYKNKFLNRSLSGIEDDIGKIFQKIRIFSEKYAQSLNDPLGIPQQFPILRGGQK